MSGEIKKIDSIRNMAVFLDFRWDAAVRDEKNNVAELKKINILYGRNYSGKTTLSRILRALETGSISSNYEGLQDRGTLRVPISLGHPFFTENDRGGTSEATMTGKLRVF